MLLSTFMKERYACISFADQQNKSYGKCIRKIKIWDTFNTMKEASNYINLLDKNNVIHDEVVYIVDIGYWCILDSSNEINKLNKLHKINTSDIPETFIMTLIKDALSKINIDKYNKISEIINDKTLFPNILPKSKDFICSIFNENKPFIIDKNDRKVYLLYKRPINYIKSWYNYNYVTNEWELSYDKITWTLIKNLNDTKFTILKSDKDIITTILYLKKTSKYIDNVEKILTKINKKICDCNEIDYLEDYEKSYDEDCDEDYDESIENIMNIKDLVIQI